MAWKNLVILFFSFLLVGCCAITHPYYTTKFGSSRPKVNRFTLNKKGAGNISLIDFDAIYALPPKKDDVYSFIRFFKEGQILVGWTRSLDNIKKFNNLERGIVGYYHISNDTIYLEQYMTSPHFCEKYYVSEGIITKDSLIFNGGNAVYKRHKVSGLKGEPNW